MGDIVSTPNKGRSGTHSKRITALGPAYHRPGRPATRIILVSRVRSGTIKTRRNIARRRRRSAGILEILAMKSRRTDLLGHVAVP